jgi:hypothetical protein
MGFVDQITDKYNRTARLMPALLIALPLSLLAVTSIPTAVTLWGKVSAVLAASGIPFILAQVVRDLGKRIEPHLYEKWSGPPTTIMLRWSGGEKTAVVDRRHALIKDLLSISLPDENQEAVNPEAADDLYATVTAAIRERTRDKSKFSLLFGELTAYGFRRNAYGCRLIGLAACCIGIGLNFILPGLHLVQFGRGLQIGLTAFDIFWGLAWWLGLCTKKSVRRAADNYARQLLASLEALAQEKGGSQHDST